MNLFSDEVTIDSTFIVADSLQLFVSYASCEQDSFSLYGYKVFLESLPAQAELYLSKGIHYESNCKMIITEKLIFDLSLLKDLYLQGSKDSTGTIMVRIHEPDKSEPIFPLVKYKF
ncbi:MAG: hypothetical protein FJ218_04640 [Ignavibacteria bacterium]|nr:hypothetical protein [Ignavibacteria bacterium]